MSERIELLGLPVDVLDRAGMLTRVQAYVDAGERRTVGYLNIHVANQAASSPPLQRFLRSVDLCYADGQGIVLGARLQGKHLPERMTGADWIWDLATLAQQRGWTLAWIGGEPGVSEDAGAALAARYPGLRVHAEHGYHSAEQVPEMLARVNAARPQIVLVGMGTPKQELWTARWRDHLDAPVVWCLGATADFVSGKTDRGPTWLNQNQEWLARLLTEPKRLWRRYLLGNPLFIARVIRERLRG